MSVASLVPSSARVLHLPLSNDRGIVGKCMESRLPINIELYFFGLTQMRYFSWYKTTGTWVKSNLTSKIVSIPPDLTYSSHRKGTTESGRTFHPSKLLVWKRIRAIYSLFYRVDKYFVSYLPG